MTAGRPPTYSIEILEKARDYIDKWSTTPRADRKNLPKVAGLAIELGVHRDTIYDWSREHEEFSYILDNLLALQEDELVESGLEGSFNPTITKLMLTKHGYRDSTELTGPNGKDLFTNEEREQADKAIKDLTG